MSDLKIIERPTTTPPREKFEGVLNIIRFNWPLYAIGLGALMTVFAVTMWMPLPTWIVLTLLSGAGVAAYLLAASLIASWWIYDHSRLYRFDWVTAVVGDGARRIVNLHSGFDESSDALTRLFPGAIIEIFDFYNPKTMTEASIARARSRQQQRSPRLQSLARRVDPTSLPLEENTIDAAFLILAAHELRNPKDRQRLFSELARSLKPGGRVVLVEHLRDLANFAVFGPQFVHFYSRRTWLDLGRGIGFSLSHERRITPFVRLFVFEKCK